MKSVYFVAVFLLLYSSIFLRNTIERTSMQYLYADPELLRLPVPGEHDGRLETFDFRMLEI
jgi:hypothetical protein